MKTSIDHLAFRCLRAASAAFLTVTALMGTGAVLPCTSCAETYTWDGNSNGNVDNGANWVGGVAPPEDSTARVVFSSNSLSGNSTLNVNLDVNFYVDSLTFAGGSSFTLSSTNSRGLDIGTDGLNQNSTAAQTITVPTFLTKNQTWSFASGAGALTFTGNGLVNLQSYTLALGAQGDNTLNGNFIGSGAVVVNGGGTLTLAGANTYTGGTTFAAGTLNVGSSGALGSSGTLSFTGGTLQYGSANTTDYSARFSSAANQAYSVDTHGQSIVYATALTSSGGSLTKLGAGALTLTAANTYTGATTVSAGTLTLGNANAVQDSTVQVAGGGTLAFAGGITSFTLGGLSGAGNVALTDATGARATILVGANNASTTYAGSLSGVGGLTKVGTGTLTLTGASAYQDTTRVNAGTLALVSGASLSSGYVYVGDGSSGAMTQTGGSFTTANNFTLGQSAGATGTYALSAGVLSTGPAYIGNSGVGVFTQSGGSFTTNGNVLTIGHANTGTYTLQGGTLAAGAVTGGNFNFNGGTLQAGASTTGFFQGLTTANVQTGGALIDTQNNGVAVAQNLVHDTTVGAPALDGGLTKLGSGTLTLAGTNTYTGGTTVNAGTLSVSSDANLGASGTPVTLTGSGRLLVTGASFTSARTFNLNFGSLSAASGGTLTYAGATINGGFLGAGGTQVLGNGTSLNGTTAAVNSALSQSGGTVTFNNVELRGGFTQAAGATLNAPDLNVTSAGVMTVGGTVNTSGAESDGVTTINSGGLVANTGGGLVFGGGSRTTVNSGGTLTTASGTTVELNGGLLVNNGTQNGTLDINYGSTARGSGTFGNVSVNTGGKFGNSVAGSGDNGSSNELIAIRLTGSGGLAAMAPFVGPQPYATPSTTNVGSLTLRAGGTFSIRVQNAAGAEGTGYDLTHASGALTLASDASASNPILIALSSLNSSGNPGAAASFNGMQNQSFVLVQADGGILGYTSPTEFAVDTSGFANATNGGSFSVIEQGNDLVLQFTAVPEPGTWVSGVLGLGVLAYVAARHKRREDAIR